VDLYVPSKNQVGYRWILSEIEGDKWILRNQGVKRDDFNPMNSQLIQ